MFASQPKPCAKSIGCPAGSPETRTLFRSATVMRALMLLGVRRRLGVPHPTREEQTVYARLATFDGDPARIDDVIARVRGQVETDTPPPGLEGARLMMLVNRQTGQTMAITLFE